MTLKERILAIDVGLQWVGLAISDPTLTIAQPYQRWQRQSLAEDVQRIWELVDYLGITKILVGLPIGLKGKPTQLSVFVENFITGLEAAKANHNVPIIAWDERFTTIMADKLLAQTALSGGKRKKLRDKIAAAIILQSYLETQNRRRGNAQ